MGTDWEGFAGDSESGVGLGLGLEEEEEERDRWGNDGNGGLGRQWRRAWKRRTLRAAMRKRELGGFLEEGFY